mgnify:FL=1
MFETILTDIQSVFASADWTSKQIAIYPDNYQGTIVNPDEYLRMNIIPADSNNYAYEGRKVVSGVMFIKIFVKAGEGQKRIMQIADELDSVLQNKTLTNKTQLGTSFITMEGLDPSNQSLYSARYTIPFKKYGE